MILIVPCFNEQNRIDSNTWLTQAAAFDKVLFVNDGSTDDTSTVLKTIAIAANKFKPEQVDILELTTNQGKAEAIRQGVLYSLNKYKHQQLLAYCDADLSTPLNEMQRLGSLCINDDIDFLLGSRIKLAGYEVDRSGLRHYLGRCSATLISIMLNISVYDTQAGAKVFQAEQAKILFDQPFISRWLFDCELILRAQKAGLKLIEEPLKKWVHQSNDSKISLSSYLNSLKDLIKIRVHYTRKIK